MAKKHFPKGISGGEQESDPTWQVDDYGNATFNSVDDRTSSDSGGGSGTVTSVAQTFTGGLISVAGSPITSDGTLALTVAGTSGGVPYFDGSTSWATSSALTSGALLLGGGAGSAPASTATGSGVVTALAVNTGSAGAMVLQNGVLGTPSSGTATNITGLPIATGVSGLGTNVGTFLATPSSANLRGALTDETGTGAAVFATSPTITGATVNGISDLSATPTRTLILTAAGSTPTTTIGASVPTVIEAGTNDIDYYVVDFDASTEERVFWNVVLPDNYGGGTVTAIFYWTNAGGQSGEDVVWGIKARAYANDDAIDQAYGTEVTVSDDWLAQNDVQATAATGAITIGGSPAGGQYFVFNVGRKVASDDLTGDARLLSVKIEYLANAYSD
jgi:hypothetical protein